jgi:diguanylate cyclase (GGDEF)-like protein
VGAAVIMAIIASTGLIVEMQRRASIDAFETATTNLGNGMAQQTAGSIGSVDRALTEIHTALTSTGDQTTEGMLAALRGKPAFDLIVEQRKRLLNVESLMLVDASGRVASTSKGWPAAANDVSDSDFFRYFGADKHHGVFVGMPVKESASGRWTAAVARGFDDKSGKFAGLVVAELSLTDLQKFYQLAMPARRSVYVVRRDGVVLVRYPPRDDEIGKKIPSGSPWYVTVGQGGGTYHAPTYFDQTPVIASVRPLRNLPLVVEAQVTEADTLADWYQQRIWVVLGSSASVICVIILLKLFAAQYRRVELSERSLAMKNAELDTAHRQLDATLSNLSQGVCFYNEAKELVVCNRRYRELYNLSEADIRPCISLAEIVKLRIAAGSFIKQDPDEYLVFVDEIVGEGKSHSKVIELTNGRIISSHLEILPGRGWVVTHEDITERRAAEAKIAFLARHDVLTGLANRALFQERLEQASALADRGRGFAVLCLDLDRFKAVNDTLGHPIGDALLRAVSDRLREVVRESDTIARLGGDEFAIIQLDVTEASETRIVARRIVQSICDPFRLEGHEVSVGTSIGIAMAPGDSSNPIQLMKCADLALYRSKQEGRGTYRFFEPSMDAAARTRGLLEADLRCAMPLGQLELHYQPLVHSHDRRLTGFEALLRWRHPTRGLVMPGEFISVAEEIGLIGDIGAWVLQRACAEAMHWPEHLRVAVNLSTRQFRGQTLVSTVADVLQRSGLSPARLELEITETVPLRQDQATLSILEDLHAFGARIALDDFGTGYSSLSYLRSFPFNTIKIDRSFVSDLGTRDESIAIIRGIIGLATSLRMSVTAEGVETEKQFEFLAAAGCTDIQGYLISLPVPAGEVPALIELLSGGDLCRLRCSPELIQHPDWWREYKPAVESTDGRRPAPG